MPLKQFFNFFIHILPWRRAYNFNPYFFLFSLSPSIPNEIRPEEIDPKIKIDQSKYKLELDIFVEGVENQLKNNDEGVNSEYRKLRKGVCRKSNTRKLKPRSSI